MVRFVRIPPPRGDSSNGNFASRGSPSPAKGLDEPASAYVTPVASVREARSCPRKALRAVARRSCSGRRCGSPEPGRPQLRRALLLALLVRSPELLARLRRAELDRLRAVGEHVDRLAQAQVAAERDVAPALLQALEQLLRASCSRARRRGASASSSSSSETSIPSASATASSTLSRASCAARVVLAPPRSSPRASCPDACR